VVSEVEQSKMCPWLGMLMALEHVMKSPTEEICWIGGFANHLNQYTNRPIRAGRSSTKASVLERPKLQSRPEMLMAPITYGEKSHGKDICGCWIGGFETISPST
jgi:hypothetical protein